MTDTINETAVVALSMGQRQTAHHSITKVVLTSGSLEKSLNNRKGFIGHILRPAALNIEEKTEIPKQATAHLQGERPLQTANKHTERFSLALITMET